MAKTFVSVLIGCAIADGYIESVEQPVGDFIPKFSEGKNAELNIVHLLTMSTGMNFDEHYINPFAFPARANYGDNLEELVLKYDVTADPGQVFEYRSGATQLLVLVLEKATGKPFSEYFQNRLWQPLGAVQNAYWSTDNNGLPKGFCCLNSNAKDFARLGQLYLDSGKWNGKTIVPKSYVARSIQPAPLKETDGSMCNRYGYSWWLTEIDGKKVFYARGILGQYVFVIPSEDMVIVRLGHKRAVSSMLKDPEDVQDYLSLSLRIE
jgi:CubicO group peptidase (beta-lactamase class C family)